LYNYTLCQSAARLGLPEPQANRTWDEVRKDVPSITFKHFTREEAIAARKQILDAFFSVSAMAKVVSRWILRDRTLIFVYLRMSIRNRIAEIVKRRRRYVAQDDGRDAVTTVKVP